MRHLSLAFAVFFIACSSPSASTVETKPECVTSSDCAASPKGPACIEGTCHACAKDADCKDGFKCDEATACVQCLAAGDCPAGQKCVGKACVLGCDAGEPCPSGTVCDPTLAICVQCSTNENCPTATPVCDAAAHTCVACLADKDCGAGEVCMASGCAPGCSGAHPQCPTGQVCDVARGGCVACLADKDCGGATPRCDTSTSTCVACLLADDDCPAGQYCAGTSCVAGCKSSSDCAGSGGGQCDVSAHACVECVDDSACSFGQVCAANHCVAGCSPQQACGGGLACCVAQGGGSNACVDLLGDAQNCGACGHACATGSGCCGGVCTSLASIDDCGACGVVCPEIVNGIRGCNGGTCGIGGCNGTYRDCDGDLANGCELDVSSDAANCGQCGHACGAPQNGAGACVAGACTITSCSGTFHDCDGSFANGCESDVSEDPSHCGACGVSCGISACVAGTCAPASCAAILAAAPGSPSGTYTIDPDGPGPFLPVQVVCDMVTDGGGWTRFHWTTASWQAGTDVLGVDLSACTLTTENCFARIPSMVSPKDLMVKDTTNNLFAAWHFNGSTISNAVLGALRDQKTYCAAQQGAWQPYATNNAGTWCGTGSEGGCDSFYYGTCTYNADIGMELDGDNAWGAAAFKEGGTGPNSPDPDWGYLDNAGQRAELGELYYR